MNLERALLSVISHERGELSLRQFATLVVLANSETPLYHKTVATIMKLSKPAITRAMDELEGRGLALRTVDTQDRRNIYLAITEEGMLYLSSVYEEMEL